VRTKLFQIRYLYKGFLLLIVTKGFFFRVVLYFFLLYIFFLPILLGEYFLDETFFLFKDNYFLNKFDFNKNDKLKEKNKLKQ